MPPVCLDAPLYVQIPHVFGCPLTPTCSPCFPEHLNVLGVSACDWGMWETFCLDASLCVQHPHHIYMLLWMSVCSRAYCMHYGRNIPYVGVLGDISTYVRLLVSAVHPLDVHYASSCTFLVVHYISILYFYCYDYYSSSDCGVFWYVIYHQ